MEGKIWKEDKWWLAEIPSLEAMTQGKTRKEVLFMVGDLVTEMVKSYFAEKVSEDFQVVVSEEGETTIWVKANHPEWLTALSLRRQPLGLCTGMNKFC